jgi:hypothetical protein
MGLDIYAISKVVNDVKNNGPDCWSHSRPSNRHAEREAVQQL